MTDKPKTVFISSTYRDLIAHRRAVWEVLDGFTVAVRGMEQFGARTEGPLETCLAEVDQSDVYIGIIGFRVGSVDSESGKSFTQLEYERALDYGKEVLIYLVDEDNALVSYADIDVESSSRERLLSFKGLLRERHTVDTFRSADDLAEKLSRRFKGQLTPKEDESPGETPFDETTRVVEQFLLVPKTVAGKEVLVRVVRKGKPFPAARALCDAFKLPYGATVGVQVEVVEPSHQGLKDFRVIFAGGRRVETLLKVLQDKPVDVYVKLHFSPDDVARTRAQFFGKYYPVDTGPETPWEEWVPADGKVILEFSKVK